MRDRHARQHPGIAGLALIMALAPALGAAEVADAAWSKLSALEGWWRWAEQSDGCGDEDNQARVALGRWHWDEATGAIAFGTPPEQKIGFYDSSCELAKGQAAGATLIFDAVCSGEGETWTDRAVFEPHTPDRLTLSFASGAKHELVRCPR